MKKYMCILIVFSFIFNANAETKDGGDYIEEMRALGAVAGQGVACNAKKYKTYEMIARVILITKAYSDKEQERGMYVYNAEKANTYFSKQMDGFDSCQSIARRFDAQEIFKATVYHDGTIKMPDGKVFTPRNPYDVTFVYDEKVDDRAELDSIYNADKKKASTTKATTQPKKTVQSKKAPNKPVREVRSGVTKISR